MANNSRFIGRKFWVKLLIQKPKKLSFQMVDYIEEPELAEIVKAGIEEITFDHL
jgi:hypothetical protein